MSANKPQIQETKREYQSGQIPKNYPKAYYI